MSDYIMQPRIGNACALLFNTQRSISLIADDVGYRISPTSTDKFKLLKQQTPRYFRAALMR